MIGRMDKDSNYFNHHGMKTLFDIAIDHDKKIIHILDIGRYATSVTNNIERLRPYIMNWYELTGCMDEWRWVLYGTDCNISEYTTTKGFVRYRNPSIKPLQEFIDQMNKLWGINKEDSK